MLGNDQRAHTDKHDKGRDDDAVLIGRQQFLPVCVFIDQSVGHENRVVIALTEDKGGQNHVDDIELHVEQIHDAQNPDPAQCHRQEGQQAQFETAKRNPQEHKYDESAGKTDIVEVVGKRTGHRTIHTHKVESIPFRPHRFIQL